MTRVVPGLGFRVGEGRVWLFYLADMPCMHERAS